MMGSMQQRHKGTKVSSSSVTLAGLLARKWQKKKKSPESLENGCLCMGVGPGGSWLEKFHVKNLSVNGCSENPQWTTMP